MPKRKLKRKNSRTEKIRPEQTMGINLKFNNDVAINMTDFGVQHGLSADNCFQLLSLEIICRILNLLPFHDVLKLSSQCKKMQQAVSMYLRILKSIDFTDSFVHAWLPATLSDDDLALLIPRCKELQYIYNFHPYQIAKRRQRGRKCLSIPGVLAALNYATNLKGIEISNIALLGAILNYFPQLKIIGIFRNRIQEESLDSNRFSLTVDPKITSLHLTRVVVPELPNMDSVQYLYLNMVTFIHTHPFREFLVPKLQTFVMSNCNGPQNALSYVPLLAGLASSQSLNRLELVKVPFMGGLIQHIVEDSWRGNGFRRLTAVLFSGCKNALELDLGYLLITAADRLKELSIQPSLTKDSLFSALNMADVTFVNFKSLYLGYLDPSTENGEENVHDGGNITPESPAMITDNGMKAVGQTFQEITQIEIYNCPHLVQPCSWFSSVVVSWAYLQHLTLRRCHSVRLEDFSRFLSHLPKLEILILEYMFREPPKGCSRVGLSAGTGLGVSSALVQNHANDNIMVNAAAEDDDYDDEVEDDAINNNDAQEVDRVQSPEEPPLEINVELNPNPAEDDFNMELDDVPLMLEIGEVQNSNEADAQAVTKTVDDVILNHSNHNNNIDLCEKDTDKIDKFNTESEQVRNHSVLAAVPSCSYAELSDIEVNRSEVSQNVDQPGCSHWNNSESTSQKTVQPKSAESKNVPSEFPGRDKKRIKCVKIISVKCRSPSPPKSFENDNNSAKDDKSKQQSGETSNRSYVFDKPPPVYSACQNENGTNNSETNNYGSISIPPPQYGNDSHVPIHPMIDSVIVDIPPPKYEDSSHINIPTPNGALCDSVQTNNANIEDSAMNVSPPDYNTAMAEGNVLSIPPCSCQISNGAPSTETCANNNYSTVDAAPKTTECENKSQGSKETSLTPSCQIDSLSKTQDSVERCDLNKSDKKGKSLSGKKKGLVKRKLSSESGIESFYCDKACQATSDEIREETYKAQQEKKTKKKKNINTTGPSTSARRSSRKSQNVYQAGLAEETETKKPSRRSCNAIFKRRRSVHHKSTSTSDPVWEEDHIQVLILRSDSLVSVKLHMVGITDLIVEDCPKLRYIDASACRVLKKVTIYSAPKLVKTQFAQCRKLDQTHLVNEVCDQISEKNRTIFLRPMYEFCHREFESMLFRQPDICYYLCVVYDYSPCPSQTLYNRMRVLNMMELFKLLTIDFIKILHFNETSWYRMDANRYPWKRDIYRLQGLNSNGSRWQMITDLPWIRMLSECPDIVSPYLTLDDKKPGLYCRERKGHYTKDEAFDGMMMDVADFKLSNKIFFCNSIVVYFNLCDTSGTPTPDIYM